MVHDNEVVSWRSTAASSALRSPSR